MSPLVPACWLRDGRTDVSRPRQASARRGRRVQSPSQHLTPQPGLLTFCRYNEPTVPPFLRRNEVLIQLEEGFTWP